MSTEVRGIADGNQMRIKLCVVVILVYREMGSLFMAANPLACHVTARDSVTDSL